MDIVTASIRLRRILRYAASIFQRICAHGSIGNIVHSFISCIQGAPLKWEIPELTALLHDEAAKAQVTTKAYMTILRHALTGMKVRNSQ